MIKRLYTATELDDLRRAVENKWLYDRYSGAAPGQCSRCFNEAEKAAVVEQRLRTHMIAGHTAYDLLQGEP